MVGGRGRGPTEWTYYWGPRGNHGNSGKSGPAGTLGVVCGVIWEAGVWSDRVHRRGRSDRLLVTMDVQRALPV